MKIAVLGAGAFGTALGGVLASNGHDVEYYDALILKNRLVDVLFEASYVLVSVPSDALSHLLPKIDKSYSLIIATKGILDTHVFDGFHDYMVVSGPSFADDIKNGRYSVLTMTDARIADLFETDFLKFDYTADTKGVLLCGALKNIYAIGAGYRGLERDTAAWKKYIRDVVREMKAVLTLNQASPDTVDLACGVEDLRLTCGEPSRNFEFGVKLALNHHYRPEKTVEGVSAIKRIIDGAIKLPEEVEILNSIIDLQR